MFEGIEQNVYLGFVIEEFTIEPYHASSAITTLFLVISAVIQNVVYFLHILLSVFIEMTSYTDEGRYVFLFFTFRRFGNHPMKLLHPSVFTNL